MPKKLRVNERKMPPKIEMKHKYSPYSKLEKKLRKSLSLKIFNSQFDTFYGNIWVRQNFGFSMEVNA